MPPPASVVGTIPRPGALRIARKLAPGAVDFLELRVDEFAALPNAAQELERLNTAAPALPAPLIVTVRHPREGGAGTLSAAQRSALLREWMRHGTWIDTELRSITQLAVAIEEARKRHLGIILSFHDFQKTPSLKQLRALAARARNAGCDIFKVAARANTPRDFAVLLEFLTTTPGFGASLAGKPALAVMGMGLYGQVSRLALGNAGSVLNYGYLDTVQVPGQWPAKQLKERLRELEGPSR